MSEPSTGCALATLMESHEISPLTCRPTLVPTMTAPDLQAALRIFEDAEANLTKLERVWKQIEKLTPSGIAPGRDAEREDLCRAYTQILEHLPALDGWQPTAKPFSLDEIAVARLDLRDLDYDAQVAFEQQVEAPGCELADYRFRFDLKRRELIRDPVRNQIERIEAALTALTPLIPAGPKEPVSSMADNGHFQALAKAVKQIDTLLGSAARPRGWGELGRHASFAMSCDLHDIATRDWPTAKPGLLKLIYAENDPLPMAVKDLGDLVRARPHGPVPTALKWDKLIPDDFERLIFALVSTTPGYENASWLTATKAPDRGRDIGVYRVSSDALAGTRRERVIIQCRHQRSKGIGPADLEELRAQMELWSPPRVDVLIVATSGRFTSDGVGLIEKRNEKGDQGLRIEPWPESHLELLLARRPDLIATFSLRE